MESISGETVTPWLIAIAIAAAVLLGLEVVKWLARLWGEHPTHRDLTRAIPARLLGRTKNALLFIVVVFIGSLVLELPARVEMIVRLVAIAAAVLQVGLWGNDLIGLIATRYQERAVLLLGGAPTPGTIYALRFLASLALWAVLLLVGLDNFGVEITTLVAGLGIGGIAVALAAQSVLGDLFASLVILLDRPFVVGDFIVLGDHSGTVQRIGIKTTRIRLLSGEQLVVPNGDLVNSPVRNFRRLEERRIVFGLGLVYSTTAEQMERALTIVREAIERQEPVRFDRAHFKDYGDSSLNIEAVYFVLAPEYLTFMNVQQAINLEILRRFNEEGFDFAFLSRTVHVQGADGVTVSHPEGGGDATRRGTGRRART